MPVAGTDNGDTVYWLRQPSLVPDEWTVVVVEGRGDDWDQFDGGIVAFLVAVFVDGRRISVFPDSFYGKEPSFTPTR
jgi:hypothetical protein